MTYNPKDPNTWPAIKNPIVTNDVGFRVDRSTAVVGGFSPFGPEVYGLKEFHEFPPNLCGSQCVNELAKIDRAHHSMCVVMSDVSSDPTYGELMYELFGPRFVGCRITRHGDGTKVEHHLAKGGAYPVYNVGRTHLLDMLLSEFSSGSFKIADGPLAQRAFAELGQLEAEHRDSGKIYKCPPGMHDDLAIALAMNIFAAKHPHRDEWFRRVWREHAPRKKHEKFNWAAVT